MMTNYLLSLPSDQELTREQIGGKAFALNKLLQANFKVPKTLVLQTTAMSDFVKRNSLESFGRVSKLLQESNKTPDEIRSTFIAQSFQYIQSSMNPEISNQVKAFLNENTVDLYAIRSSANCEDSFSRTWAGQFNSFLNVAKDSVEEKIKYCWASIFSSGVYYYYLQDKCVTDIEMAVILQEMVPANISGVGFTVNPISKNDTEVMIEFCEGLGEPLVSGKLVPSMCILNKSDCGLTDFRAGRQKVMYRYSEGNISYEKSIPPSLTSAQQKSLVDVAIKLEVLFETPQDFEWAIVQDELFVLQSRNITS